MTGFHSDLQEVNENYLNLSKLGGRLSEGIPETEWKAIRKSSSKGNSPGGNREKDINSFCS